MLKGAFVAGMATLFLPWAINAAAANPAVHLIPEDDGVLAVNSSGIPLWHRYIDLSQPLQVESLPGGDFSINGDIRISSTGRLMPSTADGALQFTEREPAYVWTMPNPVYDTPSGSYSPPVFDSKGNAWTLIQDGAAGKARVMQYVAKKGVWKSIKTLPLVWSTAHLEVDVLGNVTIALITASEDTGWSINAVRYEPDMGWSKPEAIYTEPYTPNAFLNYDVASDKSGNAVIAAENASLGAITLVYSIEAHAWQPYQQAPLPTNFAGEQTNYIALSRSDNGKYLNLVYLARVQSKPKLVQRAYYGSSFDRSTLKFGPAEYLPGSLGIAGDGSSSTENYLDQVKAVVDNSGTATVIWSDGGNVPVQALGVYANRRVGGVWKDASRLSKQHLNMTTDFSSIEVDADGRVAGCTTGGTSQSDGTATTDFVVFKFIPNTGWSTDIPASWARGLTTRTRIAWIGSGKAVGTYMVAPDSDVGYLGLSYSVFDGMQWGESETVTPEVTNAFFQSVASTEKGTTLLEFDPSVDDQTVTKVYASFLIGAQ
ncbi:hypothetical protein [Hydrocarboniphaga sp.]|uniref:hypothetical protein n=1 Tax=Hydrocarboniphaga sp. TaxID=2033016 RepID=UPI003D0D64C7